MPEPAGRLHLRHQAEHQACRRQRLREDVAQRGVRSRGVGQARQRRPLLLGVGGEQPHADPERVLQRRQSADAAAKAIPERGGAEDSAPAHRRGIEVHPLARARPHGHQVGQHLRHKAARAADAQRRRIRRELRPAGQLPGGRLQDRRSRPCDVRE